MIQEWDNLEVDLGLKFEVWKKRDPEGELTIYRLFDVREKFFYERNSWAETGENITLKASVLIKVLRYLNCQGTTVNELLSDFYSQYNVLPDIIEEQTALYRREKEKKSENKYATASHEQHISVDTIQQNTINNINVYTGVADNTDAVTQIIYQFYEHISKGDPVGYELAWPLLSNSFRERIWEKMAREAGKGQKGLDLFKDGYYFVRSVRETHVFNVKTYPSIANCMVYYEEELELPHIEELADISKMAIRNVKSLIDKIEELSRVVESFGGKGFTNKSLFRLFYPTASETIWFEHGMDHIALKNFYPATTNTTVSRLLKCRCVKDGNVWLIDGLLPFHCRQV